MAQKDQLRHYYQEAADHLVNHGKKTKRAIIFMAQLDKVAAMGKKRTSSKMLSECKTITNNATNFIGISALFTEDSSPLEGTKQNLATRQFLNVEKARKGPGGLVPVDIHFKFQRFVGVRQALVGGG